MSMGLLLTDFCKLNSFFPRYLFLGGKKSRNRLESWVGVLAFLAPKQANVEVLPVCTAKSDLQQLDGGGGLRQDEGRLLVSPPACLGQPLLIT